MRRLLIAALCLLGAACASVQRYDAANDIHALLVSIRDDDSQAFEAHIDRPALEREVERRLAAEAQKRGAGSLGALLAGPLAQLAGDALIQPGVFRAVAESYGYKAGAPLPGPLAITGSLKQLDDGRVCATKKKDGPCVLTFTQSGGVWKLSGFEGDPSQLHL